MKLMSWAGMSLLVTLALGQTTTAGGSSQTCRGSETRRG